MTYAKLLWYLEECSHLNEDVTVRIGGEYYKVSDVEFAFDGVLDDNHLFLDVTE